MRKKKIETNSILWECYAKFLEAWEIHDKKISQEIKSGWIEEEPIVLEIEEQTKDNGNKRITIKRIR